MSDVTLACNPVEEVCAKGTITAEDVLRLRRELYADGRIGPDEAASVFRLDQGCAHKDPDWTRFYVDALTDYYVWQSEPKKYVNQDAGEELIARIAADGRVDSASELELLINVVHWAVSAPESLAQYALEAVCTSVLNPDQAAYGQGRRPGVIDAVDVELVRKVLYAGGGVGGFIVTQAEAELLFDLNRQSDEEQNAPSWRDLFAKAVANYLMFPRGAAQVPSADEAARREAWLDERDGAGGMLLQIGRSVGGFDFGAAWRELDLFGRSAKAAAEAREAERAREAAMRESVDAGEAAWLLERLNTPNELSENERALLRFIRSHSPVIAPALSDFMESAGL